MSKTQQPFNMKKKKDMWVVSLVTTTATNFMFKYKVSNRVIE